jgi:hypothetical protein
MTYQPRMDRQHWNESLVTVLYVWHLLHDMILSILLDILRRLVPIWTLSTCTSPLPVLAHGVPRDTTCSLVATSTHTVSSSDRTVLLYTIWADTEE